MPASEVIRKPGAGASVSFPSRGMDGSRGIAPRSGCLPVAVAWIWHEGVNYGHLVWQPDIGRHQNPPLPLPTGQVGESKLATKVAIVIGSQSGHGCRDRRHGHRAIATIANPRLTLVAEASCRSPPGSGGKYQLLPRWNTAVPLHPSRSGADGAGGPGVDGRAVTLALPGHGHRQQPLSHLPLVGLGESPESIGSP